MSTENNRARVNSFAPLSLADRIRDFRKRRGWNQTQFAEAIGVTQSQVSRYEKGLDRPSPSAFGAIASHAEESERSLWISEAGMANFMQPESPDTREVPLLRDSAAAGTPRAIDPRGVETTLMLPRSWLPNDGKLIAIYVSGDSMSPTVNDGNIVILNVAERDPYQLVGNMVAARDSDRGVTIKWLRRDSGVFFLVPQHTSERHPIKLLHDTGDWSIIGDVVKIIGDPPVPKRKVAHR